MSIQLIGAVLVICGCGGVGFYMAVNHRRDEVVLRQLSAALDYMECELQYRMTPLPELVRSTSRQATGAVGKFLLCLAEELEAQISPDASSCVRAAISKVKELPEICRPCLRQFGKSLGSFDLPGQLKGLEAVRAMCRLELKRLCRNQDQRLRSYQTLGLCAGAALAILFL